MRWSAACRLPLVRPPPSPAAAGTSRPSCLPDPHASRPRLPNLCSARYRGEGTDLSKVPPFQRHGSDSGSPEVQIARLSARVLQLTEHLEVGAAGCWAQLSAAGCSGVQRGGGRMLFAEACLSQPVCSSSRTVGVCGG